jgi:hypothetical protein
MVSQGDALPFSGGASVWKDCGTGVRCSTRVRFNEAVRVTALTRPPLIGFAAQYNSTDQGCQYNDLSAQQVSLKMRSA